LAQVEEGRAASCILGEHQASEQRHPPPFTKPASSRAWRVAASSYGGFTLHGWRPGAAEASPFTVGDQWLWGLHLSRRAAASGVPSPLSSQAMKLAGCGSSYSEQLILHGSEQLKQWMSSLASSRALELAGSVSFLG
ncbi:hypothetical protein Dimus_000615, partial [Dionaea muscipula]